MGSTRGVHWVKYGNDKMELSAQLNCTEKAPKVECNRVKESEWAPPKPRSPAPKVKPGTVPPPRRTLGQKLKDLAFGGSKK